MSLQDIACQSNHEGTGCRTCGGYKFVLAIAECTFPGCSRQYLTRPGHWTIYAGKRFTSFDGLELWYPTLDSGAQCFSHREDK